MDEDKQGLLDFSPAAPRVLQVSELIRQAARVLEARFTDVWVEGEIDGLKRHGASGHLYFALKDGGGRVEAMMPRQKAQRVPFPVQDGLKVRARGRISLYEAQGRFQFYVEELQLTGEGELLRALQALKGRLQMEGLFSKERKRPIPAFPRRVGIVTSSSGAALHDILRVAARRGRVRFLISPCQVQGEGAAAQICAAIDRLAGLVDVIIVGRGGGSSADLWAFNDEALARTIVRQRTPIVSAVGHEVDFTICDLVADLRAPTPSAAAELVVPLFSRLEDELLDLRRRLLLSGGRALQAARQLLDLEVSRGAAALSQKLVLSRRVLTTGETRLQAQHPRARLLGDREALGGLHLRLLAAGPGAVVLRKRQMEGLLGKLDALSPLRVLRRGYAVARDGEGHVVTEADAVRPGDPLQVLLSRGELRCRVEEVVVPKTEAPPC